MKIIKEDVDLYTAEDLEKEADANQEQVEEAEKEIKKGLDRKDTIVGSADKKNDPEEVKTPEPMKLEESLFPEGEGLTVEQLKEMKADVKKALGEIAEKYAEADEVDWSEAINDAFDEGDEEPLTEAEESGTTDYIHVIFSDEDVADVEDADDLAFDMESKYNLTPTGITNKGGIWEADLEGSVEDLQRYMDTHHIVDKIHSKMNAKGWQDAYERDPNVRDLRTIVLCELSADPEIEASKLKIPYSEVPQAERYKTEDPKAPLGKGTYDISLDADANYVVHQDSPDKLEFAKKVAQVYGLESVYKEEKWRRDPSDRYKLTIKIPEETDGIDIFKKVKK